MNVEKSNISVEVEKFEDPSKPWLMDVVIGQQHKRINVYHCRVDAQKDAIARELATGKPCVAFGVGLYGLSVVLDDPRRNRIPHAYEAFFSAKSKRDPHAKIPVFMAPKYIYEMTDWNAVHPEFRKYLIDREKREKLWKDGVSFHLILPIKKSIRSLHNILITTPEDLRYAKKPWEQMVNINTVSAFWWHDPDWSEIAEKVRNYNPFGTAGISSFNEHGQQPAYTFDEVIKFIYDTGRCPFDMVVRDEIGEAVGVRSSHPQWRVPLVGESADWIVIRHGCIDIDRWLKVTDSPFPALKLRSATVAARAASPDTDLTDLVFEVRDRTLEDYARRHPRLKLKWW